MAQEGERGALLGRREAVAELGVHVEHIEQVRRDRRGLDVARVSGARQVVALRLDGRASGKVLRERAQVVEVRKGHAEVHAPEPGRHDLDEPVRSGVRQRLEQHGVDRAEDGGIGADAEREREHGDEREAGASREGADRVPEILEQGVHHSYLRATIGSTRAARREGSQQASTATAARITGTATKVARSVGETPYNCARSTRAPASAAARPAAVATPIARTPRPTNSRTTSLLRAPSAMRMPTSRVRSATT